MSPVIETMHAFLTKNKGVVILIILIGLVSSVYAFWSNSENKVSNVNTSIDQSPQCVGKNCQQIITYKQIHQEEKSIYVSPAKKLIKVNMAEYRFPLKIVNEMGKDLNDVGLEVSFPVDLGAQNVMIRPREATEFIKKRSVSIMLPCIGQPKNGIHTQICDIESIYKLEIKEYEIGINTREYHSDFFIEFKLVDLSQQPELKEIFRGFGME